MKSLKLMPQMLKVCAPAMSTEQTRYYLMGVHVFEKNGDIVYEATNGHFLIRCTSMLEQDDDLKGLDIIIPDFFVKEISKPSFLKGFGVIGELYLDATIEAQTISVEMPGGVASNKLVDGTFPSIDAVMPSHQKGVKACADFALNLEYLSKIGKSAKAFDGFTAHLAINDNSGPIYFEKIGELGKWQAALMPVRA